MKNFFTPLAIIFGCFLVAGSLYFSEFDAKRFLTFGADSAAAELNPDSLQRVDHRHLYGEITAPTTIVEFSDYECPFCSRVHPTLKRLVDESNGALSWEYRHLPIPSHRNAEFAAIVAECVAQQAGNDAFWEFSDTVLSQPQQVNQSSLRAWAGVHSLSEKAIDACVVDPAIKARIANDIATARAYGGNGTPFSVIQYPDGSTKPVVGALPYDNWKILLPL